MCLYGESSASTSWLHAHFLVIKKNFPEFLHQGDMALYYRNWGFHFLITISSSLFHVKKKNFDEFLSEDVQID